MRAEPTTAPVVPHYGESTLADLAASLLTSLGVTGAANPLGLPAGGRVCLLVVDGLGWELLRDHPAQAPFLSELALNGTVLTSGFPATTVTSLSSLAIAQPPGMHGMLGYQVAIPGKNKLLNGLRWDNSVDPHDWQPHQTIYERAVRAGVDTYRVAAGSLAKTGLSTAVMRGTTHLAADSFGALVAQAADALWSSDRCFVTVYHGQLDGTGHTFGCSSDAWRYHLSHVDKLAEQLAGALPHGTLFFVTADHGMVDVPAEDRIDVDCEPVLAEGVALLGGEPRARHVYARPGAAADVLAAWREVIGSRAWVVSREEAVEAGWFGPAEPGYLARIGDVVAAPAGPWAIVATRAEPLESSLIGMHGSLTSADQFVPLLSLPAP
ncbi:MAG TPA: nucleotide pyrophosphatase/phosphodiesterase family protein [Streptosporangiaceae bacterium]|nr:nucleotide pyrophosphatase/phosphodiesterase family protein [Streptosporangiaceae bacterium]